MYTFQEQFQPRTRQISIQALKNPYGYSDEIISPLLNVYYSYTFIRGFWIQAKYGSLHRPSASIISLITIEEFKILFEASLGLRY